MTLPKGKWSTPDGAFDQCVAASITLADDLFAAGYTPHIVWVDGFKGVVPTDAHPFWKRVAPEGWVHYAVRVGLTLIDLTGAQFGGRYVKRAVWSWKGYRRQWNSWGYASNRDAPDAGEPPGGY